MTWKQIRLTLARTPEYPSGSSEHAYELVLPLRKNGLVDLAALQRMPGRSTVQRLWPDQGTLRGAILRRNGGFAFSYEPGDSDDEEIYHLEDHYLRLGEYITLTQPDGDRLPFQVVSVRALPDQPSLDQPSLLQAIAQSEGASDGRSPAGRKIGRKKPDIYS